MHDLPVEVISYIDEDGKVTPLRFRYEDERYEAHTAHVLRILKCREIPYVGVEALVFQCLVREEERERMYELKYAFRVHRWTLQRRLA